MCGSATYAWVWCRVVLFSSLAENTSQQDPLCSAPWPLGLLRSSRSHIYPCGPSVISSQNQEQLQRQDTRNSAATHSHPGSALLLSCIKCHRSMFAAPQKGPLPSYLHRPSRFFFGGFCGSLSFATVSIGSRLARSSHPGPTSPCICAPFSSTTVMAAVLAARRRSFFLFLCETLAALSASSKAARQLAASSSLLRAVPL